MARPARFLHRKQLCIYTRTAHPRQVSIRILFQAGIHIRRNSIAGTLVLRNRNARLTRHPHTLNALRWRLPIPHTTRPIRKLRGTDDLLKRDIGVVRVLEEVETPVAARLELLREVVALGA